MECGNIIQAIYVSLNVLAVILIKSKKKHMKLILKIYLYNPLDIQNIILQHVINVKNINGIFSVLFFCTESEIQHIFTLTTHLS